MIETLYKQTHQRMQKSLDSLNSALSKVRTGRAHTSLIDHVLVQYYGNATPLNQVASIVVEDSRTLAVTPWEKNMVEVIDKALRSQDLGLNPIVAGMNIRVPLPALTEERRRNLVKQVKAEAEHAKIATRNIRREANQKLKEMLKQKEISEDEMHQSEQEIQKLTDKIIESVDKLLSEKETELMQV